MQDMAQTFGQKIITLNSNKMNTGRFDDGFYAAPDLSLRLFFTGIRKTEGSDLFLYEKYKGIAG